MQNTYLSNSTICVSQLSFSRITIELLDDQLVTSTLALADSLMMMQSCHHYWEVKSLQQCARLLAIPIISYLAGQPAVRLGLRRIMSAADDDAICQ